jgi:hypothetical protein
MKAMFDDYIVRVGYWASRNNVPEYKVYAIVMFNPTFVNNLQQALGDNLWLIKSTNYNYKTHLSC